MAPGLLVATLDGIEDGFLEERPQQAEGVSLAPKLTAEDGLVDWNRTAFAIDRQIRGCTPAPGAWTWLGEHRLKLSPVTAAPAHPQLAPGQVEVTKGGVHVGTGTHPVQLGEVQAPGKPRMPAADWMRGQRPQPARLGR